MKENNDQYAFLTQTPIPQLIIKLAIPTTFSMLISSIYNLADTFFVGQISTSASGAIGIVAILMSIIQAIGFTFGHGAGGIVSRKLGEKDTAAATRYVSTSFFSAILAGSLILVFGLLFLNPLMRLLGSTETILPHARNYARYILLAAPIMMSSLVLNNILRYEGRANFAMVGLVTGGILNMILDPIFIFGLQMGTGGAGLATALSQCVSFCILLSMFLRGKTISRISFSQITRNPIEFSNIITTGLPCLGRQGLGSVGGMLLNITASGYGDAAVAAMSIIARVFMFLQSAIIGVGQALQPVSAFNYGAQKYTRVKQACLFMIALSTALSAINAVVFILFATPLVQLFRDDPAVFAIAVPALRYQCLAIILLPTSTASNMMFQCIGKSGRALFLACCRQGIFFIPLILTLPSLLGILGIQIAQPLADCLTFIASLMFLVPFLKQLEDKPNLSKNTCN